MINKKAATINRKKILLDRSETVRSIAKKINYTRSAVNDAITGESRSYRCHSRIAAHLGMPMAEIWPELYGIVPQLLVDGEDDKGKIDTCNIPPAHL